MAFDAVAYINEPRWRHSSLGLERITLLLEKLGNPQDRFLAVHVAGTNGKGSVCSYVASILQASGLRTGLFTSPFVERFEERIQVDGREIDPVALTQATLAVRDAAEEVEAEAGEHPTEFELMCAVGFLHFAEAGCDVAVVECGLGGRLDATNVVSPALCVLTRIGMDHTDVLGDTLAAIAGEKAGIIKSGVPVVSWPQEPEAARVVEARCAELGCELVVSDFSELKASGIAGASCPRSFSYKGKRYETQLLAAYQPRNAAVAIDAANVLSCAHPELGINQQAVEQGIAHATWPGRFEVVSTEPLVVVDGAHNPDGAQALAESVRELLGAEGRKATLVVGVLADKDHAGILRPMLPFARRVVAYAPDNPRALAAQELADEAASMLDGLGLDVPVDVASSAADAVALAVQKEGPEGFVVAFGTLYSIGAVKQAVR